MKLTAKPLAAIILVVFFGGISLTAAMGWWQTKGGGGEPARLREGAQSGSYNPSDIRGSSTFGEVNGHYQVSIEDLGAAFLVPAETDLSSFKVSSLEKLYSGLPYEVGVSSVRLFVAYYTGLPYQPAEDTYLFAPAVEILHRQGILTPEQSAYLAAHTLEVPAAAPLPELDSQTAAEQTPPPTPHEEGQRKSARMVNGQTTFQDLLSWGLPVETLETLLGNSIPDRSQRVRDYCTENGCQFSTLKTNLQVELDKLN